MNDLKKPFVNTVNTLLNSLIGNRRQNTKEQFRPSHVMSTQCFHHLRHNTVIVLVWKNWSVRLTGMHHNLKSADLPHDLQQGSWSQSSCFKETWPELQKAGRSVSILRAALGPGGMWRSCGHRGLKRAETTETGHSAPTWSESVL